MEFSGRLAAFPLGDLLQWAKNERCTGALVIRRSEREKRIYLHHGEVVGCLSNDSAEYYGQHLVLNGHLTENELFRALSHCATHQGVRLGEALRKLEMLSDEVIQQTLREQIEDAVCDLFLWKRGIFFFQAELPQDEEILPHPINVMGLVMEGTRRLDEVERIRRVLVHDDVVLRRGDRWPGGDGLTAVQQRLLRMVDGQRPLGELYKKVRGSYFRFLDGAFRLCVGEVLDIAEVREATEGSTHELSVYDLLLLHLQKGRLALLPAPVEKLEENAEKQGQPVLQRWWRRVFRQAS